MPDTEMPKMQVHVATLKPWEAVLLVPTEGDDPIIATMDRRDGEFEVTVASDRIEIKSDTEHEMHEEPARAVHCPSCASADLGWEIEDEHADLVCRDCSEAIAQANTRALAALLTSDALYELPSDSWVLF